MTLDDPNRPQMHNRPAYGNPPLAVLPDLHFEPISKTECRVFTMLASGYNSFQWYYRTIESSRLGFVAKFYYHNPELFWKVMFGYSVPVPRDPAKKKQITLADLGL